MDDVVLSILKKSFLKSNFNIPLCVEYFPSMLEKTKAPQIMYPNRRKIMPIELKTKVMQFLQRLPDFILRGVKSILAVEVLS